MAFVYWIHLKEHTDVFCEGYVGYTGKSVEVRFKKHIRDATVGDKRNYKLHNAIRKYGDEVVISTLIEGSDDYCLLMEEKLRPTKNLGWNHIVGGSKPPSMLGRKMKSSTKDKIGESNKKIIAAMTPDERISRYSYLKGLKRSAETLEKYKKAQEGKHTSWLVKNANLSVWSIAQEVYNYLQLNSVGGKRLSSAFNLKECQINALMKKIKAGWNPSEDQDYLSWLDKYNKA